MIDVVCYVWINAHAQIKLAPYSFVIDIMLINLSLLLAQFFSIRICNTHKVYKFGTQTLRYVLPFAYILTANKGLTWKRREANSVRTQCRGMNLIAWLLDFGMHKKESLKFRKTVVSENAVKKQLWTGTCPCYLPSSKYKTQKHTIKRDWNFHDCPRTWRVTKPLTTEITFTSRLGQTQRKTYHKLKMILNSFMFVSSVKWKVSKLTILQLGFSRFILYHVARGRQLTNNLSKDLFFQKIYFF